MRRILWMFSVAVSLIGFTAAIAAFTGASAAPALAGGGVMPDPAPDPPTCQDGSAPPCSPIIIDVDGSGFHLTSAAHGVRFDFFGTGHPIQMAWIAPGSTNAFLVLPQNGRVADGAELFGNLTPQPKSAHPNGFLALATYATLAEGGDGGHVIDSRDAIFSRLRLWQFSNAGGRLVPGKLSTLPQLGIEAIDLDYQVTGLTDQYGNAFRYRARIISSNPHAGKWAYDVFFTSIGAAAARPAARPSPGHDGLLGLLGLLPLGLLLSTRPAIRRRSQQAGDPARERQPDLVP